MSRSLSETDRAILERLDGHIIATKKQRFFGFILTKGLFIGIVLLSAFIIELIGHGFADGLWISATVMMALHVLLLTFKQQSIGMLIVGVQIISDGSRDLSIGKLVFWRVLINWIFPFTPGIGLLSVFNYMNITGNATNRCIHDELSNTIVVKLNRC